MEVLVYAPSLACGQMDRMLSKLEEYAASGARFLVADSPKGGDAAWGAVAEAGYPDVAAYSAYGARASEDGWMVRPVDRVGRSGWIAGFERGREALIAAALDADRAVVLWDGRDRDAFAAVLLMVALGKPADVVRLDGASAEVGSLSGLRPLLPPRSPGHLPCRACVPAEDRRMVAERFVSSSPIAEGIASGPLLKQEAADVILGSPTALDVKLEALTALSRRDDVLHEIVDGAEMRLAEAWEREAPADTVIAVGLAWCLAAHGSFSTHRDAVGEALGALRSTGPGEIVYRKSFWDERPELFEEHEEGIAPFSSIDDALDDLRFEMARDEWDGDAPFWSAFEKWRLSPDGTWENPFTYYAIMDEIVFFDRNAYDEKEHCWTAEDKTYGGSIVPDLNIRVPFEVGDVITLDCRPFAPLRHALVLEAEHDGRAECCLPRVLHLDDYESKRMGQPMWTDASPKHASSMHLCMPGYSPLYRMELYDAQLPEDEGLLDEVSEWLQGDAEKGRRLSEALMCEMSSDEVRGFMANLA